MLRAQEFFGMIDAMFEKPAVRWKAGGDSECPCEMADRPANFTCRSHLQRDQIRVLSRNASRSAEIRSHRSSVTAIVDLFSTRVTSAGASCTRKASPTQFRKENSSESATRDGMVTLNWIINAHKILV